MHGSNQSNGQRLRRKLNANNDDDNDNSEDELMRMCTDGSMHVTTQMDLARKKKRLTNKKKRKNDQEQYENQFFFLSIPNHLDKRSFIFNIRIHNNL